MRGGMRKENGQKVERKGEERGKVKKEKGTRKTRKRKRGRTREKEIGRVVNDEYYDEPISHKH